MAPTNEDQSKTTSEPRSKGIMLVTRLDQLSTQSAASKEQLIEETNKVASLNGIKRYAGIIHNMDISDEGPIAPHLHIMMEFSRRIRLSTVAKKLSVPTNQLESMTHQGSSHGIVNGFCYLIHATQEARAQSKHQYAISDVVANFDYQQLIEQVQAQLENTAQPEEILNDLALGVITETECYQALLNISADTLANYAPKVKKILTAVNAIKRQNYIDERKLHPNKARVVIWISGKAGVGKTQLARYIAHKNYGDSVSIGGSDNDIYQDVDPNSKCLILDDFRPNKKVTYADLLHLLDPYSIAPNAPARYRDKSILADMIIITSPLSPDDFYQQLTHLHEMDTRNDTFQQLARRLTKVLRVMPNAIITMEQKSQGGQLFEGYSPTHEVIENTFNHAEEQASYTPPTLDELLKRNK